MSTPIPWATDCIPVFPAATTPRPPTWETPSPLQSHSQKAVRPTSLLSPPTIPPAMKAWPPTRSRSKPLKPLRKGSARAIPAGCLWRFVFTRCPLSQKNRDRPPVAGFTGRPADTPIRSVPSLEFSKQPNDFPSFTSRVRRARPQLLDKLKTCSKQPVELFPGHGKRRTASLRRLSRIPWIQKKDRQQCTVGPQGSDDATDVIRTVARFDCTKAGVLKHPMKTVC
jgi:hypothetical protein